LWFSKQYIVGLRHSAGFGRLCAPLPGTKGRIITGEPSQLDEKIPQAENLNAWPTTVFVGRNGLVRSVHTGFTSRASGELDSRLKEDMRNEIAQLLSENVHVAKAQH